MRVRVTRVRVRVTRVRVRVRGDLLGLGGHELPCHTRESVFGPREEPGDGRVVDEGGELADACAVLVAEWRHGEHDVHVLLDLLDEHRVEVGLVHGEPCLDDEWVHLFEDQAEVRLLEEVGHLAGAQHVVDVLQEDLVGDLSGGEGGDG